MKLEIQTKTITTTTTKVVKFIEIGNGYVKLDTSARFKVTLLDVDSKEIGVELVTITGEEYDNWSDDDDYIKNLITTKLGATLV
jgi:hypothetical protein